MFQWLSNILCACTSNTSKIIANINQFDQDPLGWSQDLLEHQLGEFSMAAVKANNVTEDRSQLHVGNKALFVGIYHGQNGPEASNFLSTNLCEDLISESATFFLSFFFSLFLSCLHACMCYYYLIIILYFRSMFLLSLLHFIAVVAAKILVYSSSHLSLIHFLNKFGWS
jgi:hypothetical protein